jgi:hypothetical protein
MLEGLKGRDHLVDNIKLDIKETVWKGVHWIHLASGRGQVAGSYEPSGAIKDAQFLDFLSILSDSLVGLCSMKLVNKGSGCEGENDIHNISKPF